MRRYFDYLLEHSSPVSDDEMRFPQFFVPPALKGAQTQGNTVYMTAPDWIEANRLAVREMENLTTVGPVKQHAQAVSKWMLSARFFGPETEKLRALCLSHTERHAHEKAPQTLFHKNGKTATGTYKELVIATGLDYDRVRDLLTGRDRYCLGWAASEEEAEKGRLTPGRKKKTESFSMESGTPLP